VQQSATLNNVATVTVNINNVMNLKGTKTVAPKNNWNLGRNNRGEKK
jgi:hypothetical protein